MQISETNEGGVVVLELEGRVDAATAAAFEEKVLGLIDGGTRRLVIDGAKLGYISSAGLRVFLMAAKRLTPPQGRFAVGPLQPQVREVFDIAGFSSVLSIHDTRAAALAAAR
jgi:anti-sigma B factor antagonist